MWHLSIADLCMSASSAAAASAGISGVFRNWTRGWTYKRGLRNGSPLAGSRGRAPVGFWGMSFNRIS